MGCFDEEPDHEMEEWIRSGGQCQSCGKEKSDAPICDECRDKVVATWTEEQIEVIRKKSDELLLKFKKPIVAPEDEVGEK